MQDGKTYIYLFGRLENGESFLAIKYERPYFYICSKDYEKASKLITADFEQTSLQSIEGNVVTKVITNLPKDVPFLKKTLQDMGISCFEADIRFAYRYLINNNIKGCIEIEGEYRPDPLVNRVYTEPTISPAEWTPKLKILSMDIETDLKATQIYCISFYTEDCKKVLIVSDKNFEGSESFKTEKELLERFTKLIIELDPDILLGWNFIDFDLKVIQERCKANKVDFTFGRINWPCRLTIEQSFFRESQADVPGRMVLDGIMLMKRSQIKLPDYKLNTAAKVILKKEKTINHNERFLEIERMFKEDQEKLIEYNLVDSKLVYEICEESKVIDLAIRRSILTRMALDRVHAAIAAFDSLYIYELNKRGFVAPTAEVIDGEERIKGGFVRESKPGIYENIMVFDFKSLYPSIIRTFNIDPVSYIKIADRKNFKEEEIIVTANGAWFRREEGILPELIHDLWTKRDLAKKNKDALTSNAVKLLMNSFFGVLANPTCRFYNLDVANGITHTGQFLIKLCADELQKEGYNVIYGDTDSLFVEGKTEDYLTAIEKAKYVQQKINSFLKAYVEQNYKRESFMELQFEKVFKKFLMPMVRNSEEGAKKRYAGIIEVDGKDKMDFRGLEFVRRDWTEVSKKFQLTLLEKVFNKENIVPFVKEFVQDIKAGKYDDLLVYKKALRKTEAEYTKTTPPHVQAVRKAGIVRTGIIEYIQTTNGPELVDYKKSAVDYSHYIEKQIKPIADSILVFYKQTFDDVMQGSKQKSLFGF